MIKKTVYFLCALFAFALIYQAVNILAYEKVHPIPSYEEQINSWNTFGDPTRPANVYESYTGYWADGVRIPSWIPTIFIVTFCSLIGYLYYDEWRNEKPNEMFARYGGI